LAEIEIRLNLGLAATLWLCINQ